MAVDCLCSGIWALFFGRAYQASDIGTSLAFSQGEVTVPAVYAWYQSVYATDGYKIFRRV